MFINPSPGVSSFSSMSSVQNSSQPEISVRQKEILADLAWKQQYLSILFREWINHATRMDVDVTKQINKMASVIRDQPNINSYNQLEVWLAYETTMLNIITSQMVRKMAKTHIKRTANSARAMPELQDQVGLITRCENFLMKRLPGKLPEIVSAEAAIEQYRAICDELEKMTEKILSKAKPVVHVKSMKFGG